MKQINTSRHFMFMLEILPILWLYVFQVKDFFALYPDAGSGEFYRQEALANIETNISWMDRSLAVIEAWLVSNVPAP